MPINWFISYKQETGQDIALPLCIKLKSLGESVFLDIDTEFDLHDLEKIIENADFFCFVLSKDIFKSEYCRRGI